MPAPRRRRVGLWAGWHTFRWGDPEPGWPRRHPGLADPVDHAMSVGQHRDGTLDCVCWCERSVLRVDAVMVRRGETGSCGRDGCRPMPEAA